MKKSFLARIVFINLVVLSGLIGNAQILRADTNQIKNSELAKVLEPKDTTKAKYKIIPRVATIRSAMVPGWGQIYNRQYWKVPLVAAAFGVNIYFIVDNNQKYVRFLSSYKTAYNLSSTATVPVVDFDGTTRELTAAQLKKRVDVYRRYRDGSYLILLVVWAANIVDANVTAHLKTFDLTDDISLKVQPSLSSPNVMSPVFGAKLTLAFK